MRGLETALTKEQEEDLKLLGEALHRKRIAAYQHLVAVKRVKMIQRKCLQAGVKISDLDKLRRIVNQWTYDG